MPRLGSIQRQILEAAAQRPCGTLFPFPKGLSKARGIKAINGLLAEGLIQPDASEPQARPQFLLTPDGREALKKPIGKQRQPVIAQLPDPLPRLKVTELARVLSILSGTPVSPKRYSLKAEYLQHLALLMDARALSPAEVLEAAGVTAITASGTPLVVDTAELPDSLPAVKSACKFNLPPEGSKLRIMVNLIRRPQGATLSQIARATNWQPHSIRGAVAGPLKKKFALPILRSQNFAGETIYRLGDAQV